VRVVRVTFEPGARTAWHTHPHGQLLQILSGVGRVQKAGGDIVEVLSGDVIWIEPGERHWHGAAPNRTMVHLAVQQADEGGKTATWQEHVAEL
jgi:quercetin dioxygenase-like cupin family protein